MSRSQALATSPSPSPSPSRSQALAPSRSQALAPSRSQALANSAFATALLFATLALAAGCVPAGAETAAPGCAASLAGYCTDRDASAELDVYDDDALRAYVQAIADRLAVGSRLSHPPRVVISDHDGTYAPFGDRIVIGRITLQKLGTEAEVAAVVAHEMAHVEGHHATVSLFGPTADERWLATRRDAEGVADERAVALLEHAGYAPAAMPRALAAELDLDDDEHPPRGERIARVASLANHRVEGFEGRAELLAHEDRMIVGRDTRVGARVGDAWVISSLDLALALSPADVVHVDGDALELHHGRASLTAYAVGAPWARQLAGSLDRRAQTRSPLGHVTVGVAPELADDARNPLARLERAVRETLPRPPPGTIVVVIDRCVEFVDADTAAGANARTAAGPRCGGLVIELETHGDAQAQSRWLGGLRAATGRELVVAAPTRIALVPAPHTARVSELVQACPDPAAALKLDNAERMVDAGEPFKCTDHRARPNDAVTAQAPRGVLAIR